MKIRIYHYISVICLVTIILISLVKKGLDSKFYVLLILYLMDAILLCIIYGLVDKFDKVQGEVNNATP